MQFKNYSLSTIVSHVLVSVFQYITCEVVGITRNVKMHNKKQQRYVISTHYLQYIQYREINEASALGVVQLRACGRRCL